MEYLLAQRGVEHPVATELLPQVVGAAEHATEANVLAENDLYESAALVSRLPTTRACA
jgi:hypothetical protein